MKLSKTFIPMPYSFDATRLAEEALALPESSWMTHPSGFQGNSAVPLISVGAGNNNDFNGGMSVTPHLERCSYHQQVLASFDEILGRSRLMKLEPGAEVSTHVDGDYHWHSRVRVHVPIITDPGVAFYCADDEMHMKAGECWIFDTWQLHRVVNNSPNIRIHLVVDLSGSSRFWETVRSMEAFDQHTPREELDGKIKHLPYEEGKAVSIQTENFNITPILAPGEMDALIEDLVSDFDGNPTNNPLLEESYKRFLSDFSKDWRQTWHQFGYQEAGWPQYQNLVRGLQGQLKRENIMAVTLKSNRASANFVILKRIVQPALNTDVLSQLV